MYKYMYKLVEIHLSICHPTVGGGLFSSSVFLASHSVCSSDDTSVKSLSQSHALSSYKSKYKVDYL
jgi:hypothetical protein